MVEDPEVFDSALALASLGGDREYLKEVAGVVQAAWPTLVGNIRQALAVGDLCTVETNAWLAKAAARNISARRAYKSALVLEVVAHAGDLEAARSALAKLEQDLERLKSALARLGNVTCSAQV
jgi:hypothetical protein